MQRSILILLLAMPLSVLAQQSTTDPNDHQNDLLGKGVWNVSLNGAGGYAGYRGAVSRLTPRISYFLKDGWSVSLEGRHETVANRYRYNGMGLSTRYYFVRDRRLALFLQGGLTAGHTDVTTVIRDAQTGSYLGSGRLNTPTVQGNLGLGVHYRLGNRWAIEGNVEGTAANRHYLDNTLFRTQANIGVSFKIR